MKMREIMAIHSTCFPHRLNQPQRKDGGPDHFIMILKIIGGVSGLRATSPCRTGHHQEEDSTILPGEAAAVGSKPGLGLA
jgi:hypothetical protein